MVIGGGLVGYRELHVHFRAPSRDEGTNVVLIKQRLPLFWEWSQYPYLPQYILLY